MNVGFVKLLRTQETAQLVSDPNALALLTLVALRANWSGESNLGGLGFAQAHVGDLRACGLTEKEYREAKKRLTRYGLATFTGTRLGTVATLTDSRVFSIASERGDPKGDRFSEEKPQNGANETADQGRTKGGRRATNEEIKRKEGKTTKQAEVVFPPALDTHGFKAAWNDWQAYAAARRLRKWVPQTVAAKLAELEALGEAGAIAAIRASIANGWQSIYPPRENSTATRNLRDVDRYKDHDDYSKYR